MTEPQPDREFLLSIFLMEAWDTVSILEEGAPGLSGDGDVEPLLVVAHRLRGAAALHGFPVIAAEAAGIEGMLERAAGAEAGERAEIATALSQAVTRLREGLDRAAAGGVAESGPAAAAPTSAAVAGGLGDELAAFYAGNADVLEYFGPEATEHLDTISTALLAIEGGADHAAEVGTLFRAFHTLKGAAYTVGCRVIGDCAHRVEDVLVAVRERRQPFTVATLEAVFASADAIRLMLATAGERPRGLEAAAQRASALIAALVAEAHVERVEVGAAEEAESAAEHAAKSTAVGSVGSGNAAVGLDSWNSLASPSARTTIRVPVGRLDSLMNLVGELVIARSRMDDHLGQLDRVGELLLWSRSRMAEAVRTFEGKYEYTALPAMAGARAASAVSGPPPTAPASIGGGGFAHDFEELEFDRYDDFNILARRVAEVSADVAEVQAQLLGLVRAVRDDAAQVQRLTWGLRGEITRARMVPIGTLFSRYVRRMRAIAREAGKSVDLQLAGEGVELDNTIIEQIADPLLHLVQNAVFHGIEPEAERRVAGKPASGTVHLRAYQEGGAVYVEVEDDGRGIDADRLRASAVRGGFLDEASAALLGEREGLDLIFLPGLSTAEVATSVAGRGVGMDVVRTNVLRLGGEIDVETEIGVGTRFTLKLPLTVLIGHALGIRVGKTELAVPVTAVRGLYNVAPDAIQAAPEGELVEVEGELLEVMRLDRVLGLVGSLAGSAGDAAAAQRIPVVALRAGRRVVAVVVDELLGKQEIVIKSLGAFLDEVGPWAGASISGDGRVVLLLDPTRLVERARAGGRPVPKRAAVEALAPAHQGPPRVLVVDDSLSVRKFVALMLERAGLDVRTASDGYDAITRLGEGPVDVVVTDLEMPRVNGFELIGDLRRRPETRDVPVVVLTTRAGEKHLALARRLGVEHYVTKPVDERAFVALVSGLAARRARSARRTA
jgi:chemosensory pili system protein ChpA (sensor histidine kinase/response regulator)